MSGAVEGVELLPCPNPWCEGVEGVEASHHIVTGKWHICCDDCMIESPWADSYDLAIAAWNTRTTPPARSYADGLAVAAKHLDERAERARVAAIGGGMDPLDAELLDYEYSNAAAAIRLLSQGGKA